MGGRAALVFRGRLERRGRRLGVALGPRAVCRGCLGGEGMLERGVLAGRGWSSGPGRGGGGTGPGFAAVAPTPLQTGRRGGWETWI